MSAWDVLQIIEFIEIIHFWAILNLMDFNLRDFTPADIKAVHALNEGAVPNMNSLTISQLEKLISQAAYMRVATVDGKVAGFLLGMGEGQDYLSLNYQWFSKNCKNFVYIDRVVVAEEFRGRGIAKAFYNDMTEFSKTSAQWLACEVNLLPPNPDSIAFHHKYGFYEIGQQDTENNTKRVSLLIKSLHVDQPACSIKKVA